MKIQKTSFKNRNGHELSARIEMPEHGDPIAWAVFAHCFTCNKNLTAIRNIAHAMNEERIAVLSFDFTGLGESEGEFPDTDFSSNVSDIVDAVEFMESEGKDVGLLVGHSLGGAGIIRASEYLPGVKAIATIGAPADPAHVKKHFVDSIERIETEGKARVNIGGRDFVIKKHFLEDITKARLERSAREMHKPLLILHSPTDEIVGVDNARRLFEAAFHPKSFVSIDGADHLLTRKTDSRFVGHMIASWAYRFLAPPEERKLETDHQLVVATPSSSYTTDIATGGHRLIADEPVKLGGNDYGPNPYDYLLASLGACTSMTIQMYARRKGWTVDEVRVHLSHQKIHVQDCEDCETPQGKIDEIQREVELLGELSGEQRERLMEIADKCPVHRTLHSEIKVRTSERH